LNLLSYQGLWAYLTNVSCWAWPTYNLSATRRTPIEACSPDIFAIDSKRLKLDPSLIVPSEAEDLMARAIPCYERLAGHEYRLLAARLADSPLLRASVAAHLAHFGRSRIVLKSPFNTFRVCQLLEIFGPAVKAIHIHRDGYQTADSISRNRFIYHRAGRLTSPSASWATHVETALEAEAYVPTLRLALEDLRRNPMAALRQVFEYLEIVASPRLPEGAPSVAPASHRATRDPTIEDLHKRLGRKPRMH
jgi:hypothetical protein